MTYNEAKCECFLILASTAVRIGKVTEQRDLALDYLDLFGNGVEPGSR